MSDLNANVCLFINWLLKCPFSFWRIALRRWVYQLQNQLSSDNIISHVYARAIGNNSRAQWYPFIAVFPMKVNSSVENLFITSQSKKVNTFSLTSPKVHACKLYSLVSTLYKSKSVCLQNGIVFCVFANKRHALKHCIGANNRRSTLHRVSPSFLWKTLINYFTFSLQK